MLAPDQNYRRTARQMRIERSREQRRALDQKNAQRPVLDKSPERTIVGFFIHEHCHDIGYWSTVHPQSGAMLTSADDRAMNGGQAMLIEPPGGETWVQCLACRRMMKLTIRTYRAIPRPDDVTDKPSGRRRIVVDK